MKKRGYSKSSIENGFQEKGAINYGINKGVFYIIQTNPDSIPARYKFGFTNDIGNRTRSYKSVCPNMKLIDKFECNSFHELPLLKMVSKYGKRIGQELYEVEDIHKLIKSIKEVLGKLLP
ncbi:MAG: GIY-YIG nuclease family protein [Nanoarchaeota archaeon]|nr:GIY-YIG nuclease family protein [Nanoarchaeota archaeon]